MRDSIIKNKNRIYSSIIWIILWIIINRVSANPILFPSPFKVIKSLIVILKSKESYINILSSIINIGLGLIVGVILGIILGYISYKSNLLKEIILIPINIMKATPIASIVIILLVWFTSKHLPITVVMLIVIPNIYYSVYEALINVDSNILELADVFRVQRNKIIRFVYISKIKEFLIPSIIVSIGLAWKSGVSAEIIALVKNSIGESIYYSKLYLDISELFAWTIIIIVISKGFEYIITRLLLKVSK